MCGLLFEAAHIEITGSISLTFSLAAFIFLEEEE